VLHFSSAGTGGWKIPQWALFRTEGRADGDFVALIFKGTEAASEWVVDFTCTTSEVGPHGGLKLHTGFSANLSPHISAVEAALLQLPDELQRLPLYFGGHSLGGAYAMCAFYMVGPSLSERVHAVLGFGAPLVTAAGMDKLEVVQRARQRFLIYAAGDDIVPRSLYRTNVEKGGEKLVALASLFKKTLSEQQLASAKAHLPSFEPIGEFRMLPGAVECKPSELLPIRADAPLTAHIDDHHIWNSYARRLDGVLTSDGSPSSAAQPEGM